MQPIEVSQRGVEMCFLLTSSLIGQRVKWGFLANRCARRGGTGLGMSGLCDTWNNITAG